MQFVFGSGAVWNIPQTTVNSGAAVANPTPTRLGILQDVSIDFDAPIKELYGTYQYPVALGRGKGKISGKARFAQLNADAWNGLFFGDSTQPVTGVTTISQDEPHTPVANTFTVTNTTGWVDLGVRFASSGLYLTRVASAPAAGQYSASAGVYTFNAGDTGAMLVDYEYTTTGGYTININNQLLGNIPIVRMILKANFSGKLVTFDLFSCVSEKLSLATKLDDFAIPECDFQAFANSANQIGLVSMQEI